jgi:hypothetical protein
VILERELALLAPGGFVGRSRLSWRAATMLELDIAGLAELHSTAAGPSRSDRGQHNPRRATAFRAAYAPREPAGAMHARAQVRIATAVEQRVTE